MKISRKRLKECNHAYLLRLANYLRLHNIFPMSKRQLASLIYWRITRDLNRKLNW